MAFYKKGVEFTFTIKPNQSIKSRPVKKKKI